MPARSTTAKSAGARRGDDATLLERALEEVKKVIVGHGVGIERLHPVEAEGLYPLPEAQRDRFLMKVSVGYPSHREEMTIVERMGVRPPHADKVLTPAGLIRLQAAADDVFVDPAIIDYAVQLVQATRQPMRAGLTLLTGQIAYGASPRASLALVAAARGLALLRGRTYALPQDVSDCY